MRAAILRGQRDVVVEELASPQPGPGEIVLAVEAALTCGTDAKVFRRGYHARMLTPPCAIGHEYSGVVAAVGAGVTAYQEGDAVVGGNSAPCGDCEFCHASREALCDDLMFVNGAFADRLLLPARLVSRNLHPRPPGLSAVVAAAMDPVACVLKGVEIAAPRAGETALLLGSGPIACLLASELAARGADSVVFARSAAATRPAEQMGAARTVVAGSLAEAREELMGTSPGGRGFHLVVEAAGAAETTEEAPRLARKGGRVLFFGGCAADARVEIAPAHLHYDEVALLSSFHHTPRHLRGALSALASGRIDIAPLLEAAVPLEGVADALGRMCSRELRGKVPVLPHGVDS